MNNWHIKNCFFQGTISNGYCRGGILGSDMESAKAVENCYYITENVPYGTSTQWQEMANLGTGITLTNVVDGEYTWKLDTGNGGSHNHIWQQELGNSQSLPRVGTDSEKRVYKVSVTGVDDTTLSSMLYTNNVYTIPAYNGVTYKDASEQEVSGQQTITQDTAYKAYGNITEALDAKLQLMYEQKGPKLTITARITNENGSVIVGTLTESLTLYKGADATGEVLEAKAFANGKNEVTFEIDVTDWPVEEYDFYVSYPGDVLILACDATLDVNLTGEAAVGETEYMTVQKACDAAAESTVEKTVTLLKDIRVENAVVLDHGQVTLDNNGYTLSGAKCVQVTGDAVSGSSLESYDDMIKNGGELVIANSNLKSNGTILTNYEKLYIEGSILETKMLIFDNTDEVVMKDCVGKGHIDNSGKEISIINCNITSLFDVIYNEFERDSKVIIENSVLETLGDNTVIEENVLGATGIAVMEIKNSSLIAPASGYAIAEPEPTNKGDSATGQGVAPDVSDTEESEEAEEEDDTTVEVKYILENALIFGACDSPYSKGLEYTAWGNVSLPKSLIIPAGKTFTVKDKGILTIPSGMELTNNGTLLLDGQLRGDGLLSGITDAVFKMSWFTEADVSGMKSDGYDYKGSAYTLADGLEDVTVAATKTIMEQTFVVDTSGYAVSYENNAYVGDAAKIVWTKKLVDGSVETIEKTFTINKAFVVNPDTIMKAYEHSTIHKDSIDVEHMLPKNCGDVSYKVTTTGNIRYVTAPAIENGILSYVVDKDIEAVTGTIQIEVTMKNYENVLITVTLIRTPCSHVKTVTKNAVEPKVGKAGYTGDIYCADCDELLVTGEAIDALEPTPGPTGSPKPSESPAPSTSPGPSESPSSGPGDDLGGTEEPTPGPTDTPTPEPGDDVMKGDVDGNKAVNLTDAQMALKMALKIIANPTEQQKNAADVDGKAGVALSDAQMILKYALKIINKFE